jgi:hypothetical protein
VQKSPTPTLELIESVRCLGCGAIYAKPAGGGTVVANPGCPDCSYLGWLRLDQPFARPRAGALSSAS